MIEIKCIKDDMGNEYLPHFADTELYSEENVYNLSKRQEKLIMLYNAITNAENYWYLSS